MPATRNSLTRSGTAVPVPAKSWCWLKPFAGTLKPLSTKPWLAVQMASRTPMGTVTLSTTAPAAPLSTTSARTLYMYVLSVFQRFTLLHVMAGMTRAQPPALIVCLVDEVATVAPEASITVSTSVVSAAAARPFWMSTCALMSADAAVCGPMAPSGPELMAPVGTLGK